MVKIIFIIYLNQDIIQKKKIKLIKEKKKKKIELKKKKKKEKVR